MLDKKDFAQLEALVASKGFPESAAREYNPAMLALLLDLPGCAVSTSTARPYVDEIVANIARDNKIETVGLEQLIEQVEILNGLPRDKIFAHQIPLKIKGIEFGRRHLGISSPAKEICLRARKEGRFASLLSRQAISLVWRIRGYERGV